MSKTVLVVPDGYEVTTCGKVFNTGYNNKRKDRWGNLRDFYIKPKEISPFKDRKGYLQIMLGRGFRASVHRLVAETYIPNPHNKEQVNHIDGDKTNNHVSNLEWVTASENMTHAGNMGLRAGPYGKQKLVPCRFNDLVLSNLYLELGSFSKMDGFMGCHSSTIARYMKKRELI